MNFIKRAKNIAQKLVESYQKYGANIEITDIQIIRSLQRYIYTVRLSPGTKVKTIFDCANDIKYALGLHLIYPIKMEVSIFIAVSEHEVKENKLLKILRSPQFSNSNLAIPLALGYDIRGNMHIADLTKLIHLLIVGPSGTGKSIALQCIILSILVSRPASSVMLLLFDIGGNSLSLFSDVVHLYHPLVKEIQTGISVLDSLVAEMEERINLGENVCKSLPFIVCIIDEFDETIASIEDKKQSDRFVNALNSIMRIGRKAKIILILASHDPALKNTKVNVNLISSRIVFQCAKQHNSLTAGVAGADKLPGGGAMFFKSQAGVEFLQGSFVTTLEIERILSTAPQGYDNVKKLKIREPESLYLSEVPDEASLSNADVKKANKELADIAIWALSQKLISSRQMQNHFKMSKRADGIINKLKDMGIVSEKFSKQPRTVLPNCLDDLSQETLTFLNSQGYSTEAILKTINSKSTE